MITLIGYPVSPFVRKVRVVLEHKKIAYNLDPVVPYTQREKVLPLNPAGTVPVLVRGTEAPPIVESADIVNWAEREVPEPSVIPSDRQLVEKTLELQRFADNKLAQAFGGMMFGQRIVVPYYFGKEHGKEQLVARAMQELAPPLLDKITDLLGDQHFAVSDFSVADVAMASWLRGAELAGFRLDAAKWPVVDRWLRRVYAQDGYRQVIEKEESTDVVKWARQKYGKSE